MTHIDLKTAFLQGEYFDNQRGVICQIPKEAGYPPYMAARLKRAAYGLNDAPRLWWNRLDKTLQGYGLKTARADRCCYVLYEPKPATSTWEANNRSHSRSYGSEATCADATGYDYAQEGHVDTSYPYDAWALTPYSTNNYDWWNHYYVQEATSHSYYPTYDKQTFQAAAKQKTEDHLLGKTSIDKAIEMLMDPVTNPRQRTKRSQAL